MQALSLLVLGYGHVARALFALLDERRERLRDLGASFVVAGVAGRSRGVAADPAGLDPRALAAGGGGLPWRRWRAGEDGRLLARAMPADVLVELTSLDAATGRPAAEHLAAALESGKHVVTANKGPLAWAYPELCGLAARTGRLLRFEAAVMDGAPVFSLFRRCLPACRVTGVRGILNSTTNFILDEMALGREFGAALAAAQELGIAEADPALDLEGFDAALKLTVLANVMLGARLTPAAVERQGIAGLTPAALASAARRGMALKLVCEARREVAGDREVSGGRVTARVAPAEVPLFSPYAAVRGTSSILTISTDLLGDLTITEEGPRLAQTAYGVLADLLEICQLQSCRAESGHQERERKTDAQSESR